MRIGLRPRAAPMCRHCPTTRSTEEGRPHDALPWLSSSPGPPKRAILRGAGHSLSRSGVRGGGASRAARYREPQEILPNGRPWRLAVVSPVIRRYRSRRTPAASLGRRGSCSSGPSVSVTGVGPSRRSDPGHRQESRRSWGTRQVSGLASAPEPRSRPRRRPVRPPAGGATVSPGPSWAL
jgi:hypothetical protein